MKVASLIATWSLITRHVRILVCGCEGHVYGVEVVPLNATSPPIKVMCESHNPVSVGKKEHVNRLNST